MFNAKQISLILHTCDKYEFCWEGFFKSFSLWKVNTINYFCNEEKEIKSNFIHLPSGKEEWSNRLIKILNLIDTKYIFYIQEDMWLKEDMTNEIFEKAFNYLLKYNLKCIHIAPDSIYYNYKFKGDINIFSNNSDYVLNHQPAIWEKDFFLKYLIPNETPWQNEIDGSKRMTKAGDGDKNGIMFKNWYNHVCIKGKLYDNNTCS